MPIIDVRAEIDIPIILLATDVSASSQLAAAYAKALAHRFSSTVELTHIVDLSVAEASDSTLIGLAIDERRREGKEGLERLTREFPKNRTQIKEAEALSVPEAILASAHDSKADLIVMGTASKHGFKKLILGSTAESVIRRATCPVLTVGPHVAAPSHDPLAFQTIVYATDFSQQAAKAAAYAFSFAQDSGAHLYLCYVLGVHKPKDSEKPLLQASFERSLKQLIPPSAYDWCSPECVVEHGDSAEAILGLAERVHADLIVLGARKATFWLKYVETGLTPSILAGAKCPVLTIC